MSVGPTKPAFTVPSSGSRRNPATSFINRLRTNKRDKAAETEEKAPIAPWWSYRGTVRSPMRAARRQRSRDQAATTKRFYRQQATALRQVAKDRQIRAVAVLAEVERRGGLQSGGLMGQLIADGKLNSHVVHIAGWKDGLPSHVRTRKASYTPVEILEAFGMDDNVILDLYESLQEQRTGVTIDETAAFA